LASFTTRRSSELDQPLPEGLPAELAPAGALDGRGRLGELLLERIERAEVLVDGRAELAVGAVAAVGGQVVPEDRVQDVPRQVERQGLLQADQPAELTLVAGLLQLLQGVVGALD